MMCYTQNMDKKTGYKTLTEYKNHDFYFLHFERETENEGFTREKWQEHSFYELMFNLEGENEYVIENRRYVIKKGDVLLIKPGAFHYKRRVIKSPMGVYCLGFIPEKIENGGIAERIFEKGEHFFIGTDSALAELLSAAKKKLQKSKNNALHFIKAMTESLVLILSDLDINEEKTPDVKNKNVQKMLDYIKENLPSIKRVEDISNALFFSDSYTRTLFKKEMNIGIMEYVRNKKVLLAHRKIRHGKKPTEVYAECGFSNYTSFYRAYLAYLGYSPRMQKI